MFATGLLLLAAAFLAGGTGGRLSFSQITAGFLAGVSFALVIGMVQRWSLRHVSSRHHPHRIDTLPEPLAVHQCLFQTDLTDPLAGWIQHDQYQDASELTCNKGVLRFVTPAHTADEWDYLHLDVAKYPWRNYSWRLKIKRETAFREFAFNFRYQDFDNRYRYRFEAGKIFFDKKVRGEWTNNIASCPFSMKLGQWYDLRIDVCASLCRCYVDDHLWLENTDADLGWGTICVILWEDDGRTDMVAEVGPMVVHEIKQDGASVSQI